MNKKTNQLVSQMRQGNSAGVKPKQSLDQFYTNNKVSKECLDFAKPYIKKLAGDGLFYIEPSAGDGAFFNILPPKNRFGIDLEPKHEQVQKGDFLKKNICSPKSAKKTIIIGNPPFGKRGKLATEFVNRALTIGDTVAFIVPVVFRKYSIHRNIMAGAKLIAQKPLAPFSFRVGEKPYSVNAEFQIWTRLTSKHKDLRIKTAPPIKHADFEMWQYNNTIKARKYFKENFQFAIPCQGYQDYSRRETNEQNCEKHKQWMLFNPHTKKAKEILHDGINYTELAARNTTTVPGYRKADIVSEFLKLAA